MKTLKEYIQEAEEKKIAIGHFNISNIEALWAIFHAARAVGVPVVIGLSEGERDYVGINQAVALVRSLREQYEYPIFINADHTYTFERVKEAIDAGVDSVIFDGAKLSLEENIEITKQCVEYARSVNPAILVEAEMGYIGSSSKMLDEIPEGASVGSDMLTSPDDAKRFVEETGVDLFSPAVGNIHGMLKGISNPNVDSELVTKIREAAGVPLVLHGGSGITDESFTAAIEAGIGMVHINTEIRVAFRDATKKSLEENPEEVAPYRIMKPSIVAMQEVIEKRLRLFSRK